MDWVWRGRAFGAVGIGVVCLGLAGCASPGLPRSPTLNLPTPVTDLAAMRRGGGVDLRFTVPQRNTDKLPYKADAVKVDVCRAVDGGACLPVASLTGESFARMTAGKATVAELRDELPAALTVGGAHLLAYKVELLNPVGKTAGYGDAAYTAAGAAPAAVEGLVVEGSRLGIVVSWQVVVADGSEVALRREELAPKPVVVKASGGGGGKAAVRGKAKLPSAKRIDAEDEANVVWLGVGASAGDVKAPAGMVLDATAATEEPYRYSAERRRVVQLGGRAIEMRGVASAGVVFTLHDVYPPPVPTDLSVAAFAVSNGDPTRGFAVDLIWQPVDDAGLGGYNVYRQALDAKGAPVGVRQRLNSVPVKLPGYHDVLSAAMSGTRYRYGVAAVDAKGNESAACETTLEPEQN